jgi:general secretion pathway protein J
MSLLQRGRAVQATPPGARDAKGGFTLVELLVAISIMSLVAIIAWRGLSALVATRDRLGPEADDVRALLTVFGQIDRDLAHAVNPALVLSGSSPVTVQTVDGSPALQILRFAEPLADGASAVQQVTYTVVDGALLRQCSAPVRSVQAAASANPSTVRLITGVTSIQVRFWRVNQGWIVPAPDDATPPPGVEVVVNRSDGTSLRRVLLVG